MKLRGTFFAILVLSHAAGMAQTSNEGARLGRDIFTISAALKDIGLKPEDPVTADGTTTISVDIEGTPTTLILGGCNKLQSSCTYAVLISSYTDIINPSAEWIATQNTEFDLIKVSLREDKTLGFNHAFTTEGMTRDGLRSVLKFWSTSSNGLAEQAVKDKVTKP
jgi:hypothetical protein